jgi:Ca2+-binding EF-hand superfamily protein
MQENISIEDCFDIMDTDSSSTISKLEFTRTLNKIALDWTDKDSKMFIERLFSNKKDYITKEQFVNRFWSAYSYEEIYEEEEEEQEEKKEDE